MRTRHTWVPGQHMLKRFWTLITYGNNFAVGESIKISHNVWSPVATANDTYFEHIVYFL
jgi:hypothetical protein